MTFFLFTPFVQVHTSSSMTLWATLTKTRHSAWLGTSSSRLSMQFSRIDHRWRKKPLYSRCVCVLFSPVIFYTCASLSSYIVSNGVKREEKQRSVSPTMSLCFVAINSWIFSQENVLLSTALPLATYNTLCHVNSSAVTAALDVLYSVRCISGSLRV